MSERNRTLRLRVQEAAGRAATTTEHALRRIGADLHDGPAQYLAFAALRLDDLRDEQPNDRARQDLDSIKDAVGHAMEEVRAISRGLTLPDLAEKPLGDIVAMAIEAHEARTGERVEARIVAGDPPGVSHAMRICAFRFVQEGLNNASRHAGGTGLAVTLGCTGGQIRLGVADRGPGFDHRDPRATFGLGLTGLRDRVESLGGGFAISDRFGGGTELSMTLHLGGEK